MGNIIIVSPKHGEERPIMCNLGDTTLIITNDSEAPDAFELVAPKIDESKLPDVEPDTETIILDEHETYNLYQCLHALLFAPQADENAV
jgi:hypothetical protein